MGFSEFGSLTYLFFNHGGVGSSVQNDDQLGRQEESFLYFPYNAHALPKPSTLLRHHLVYIYHLEV